MSFSKTTKQFLDGTKDVTRRVEHRSIRTGKLTGWAKLCAGDYFTACEKVQGLKRGEHIKFIGYCRCISNKGEPLNNIIKAPYRGNEPGTPRYDEPTREGFPEMTPKEFVDFFCTEMKCRATNRVRRIEFVRL